jgi:DNA-binding HxlR family transcriptional regulator
MPLHNRGYGQYCGFARALELVGERWSLMIVRDLFSGVRRFTDLQRGLGKIPSNILTTRLKELEGAGIVERITVPNQSGVFYQLTDSGLELEDTMVALGRWGAKRLGEIREGEIITPEAMLMALRSTFHAEHAAGEPVRYELHFGPMVLHAIVRDAALQVGIGPIDHPDLVIEASPAIRAVMAGEVSPKQALHLGLCAIQGKRARFERFAKMFRI